jgi:hypothetical protein
MIQFLEKMSEALAATPIALKLRPDKTTKPSRGRPREKAKKRLSRNYSANV